MKNTKSSIFSISPKRYFLSAVIVAAGSGTRMGSSVPKQFLPLRDVPVIIRTLQQFEKSALVREIIVVARPEDIAWYPPYIEQYSLSKVKKIVPGGATRQLSALLGLQAISDRSKFIAIHDGARCLIQPEQIDEVARCGCCMSIHRYDKTGRCQRKSHANARQKASLASADPSDVQNGALPRLRIYGQSEWFFGNRRLRAGGSARVCRSARRLRLSEYKNHNA